MKEGNEEGEIFLPQRSLPVIISSLLSLRCHKVDLYWLSMINVQPTKMHIFRSKMGRRGNAEGGCWCRLVVRSFILPPHSTSSVWSLKLTVETNQKNDCIVIVIIIVIVSIKSTNAAVSENQNHAISFDASLLDLRVFIRHPSQQIILMLVVSEEDRPTPIPIPAALASAVTGLFNQRWLRCKK